jgi:hypothetical protein
MFECGRRGLLAASVAGVGLLAGGASAGTITAGDLAGGTGGITYAWQIELTGVDAGQVTGNVGSKSWADPSNPGLGSFGLNGGWTHTSNWIYVSLDQAAEITFTLAPNGSVPNAATGGFYAGDLVPAFSLWSGIDNDGTDDHYYEQGQKPHWIDAVAFAFLDHADEGPGPFAGSVASLTVNLPAGEYTLAIGGHDDVTAGHRAGYTFRAVVAPEPGTTLLLGSALVLTGAFARRGRRNRG